MCEVTKGGRNAAKLIRNHVEVDQLMTLESFFWCNGEGVEGKAKNLKTATGTRTKVRKGVKLIMHQIQHPKLGWPL